MPKNDHAVDCFSDVTVTSAAMYIVYCTDPLYTLYIPKVPQYASQREGISMSNKKLTEESDATTTRRE